MKSTINIERHAYIPDQRIVEVYYAGKLVCIVAGADGPGVRVISKYPPKVATEDVRGSTAPGVVEVTFEIT